MKLLFASDIHGDRIAAASVLDRMAAEGADRLVLLGDILYHGPRNDLPAGYDPKGVIALLNAEKHRILAVRGNCDTEVDQMVLEFPILADYAILPLASGGLAYLTHGHRYHEEALPPLCTGDMLIHGHTHVAGITTCTNGCPCLNPGSVSIPKGGTPPAYMTYENGVFEIKALADGEVLATLKA